MDELTNGLSQMMETKRLQVLKQSFNHIKDHGENNQSSNIIKDTLRKIACRNSNNQSLSIQQEDGLVKSVIELTAALEPMLNDDNYSEESKECVKIALMSTLEQGVRLQNTIGINSLTSSIVLRETNSVLGATATESMNCSQSSSVTNSAMISTRSDFRENWNISTRFHQSSSKTPSLSPSIASRASIMYTQAEKILREHNEKLTKQIETLDCQVVHVTAERNKLRTSTRITQQNAAKEVELAKQAVLTAQNEKEIADEKEEKIDDEPKERRRRRTMMERVCM